MPSTMANDERWKRFDSPRPVDPAAPTPSRTYSPAPEDRRIADAPRNLPRQPARRRHAGEIAAGVDAVAVDGAPEMVRVDEPLARHLGADVVAGLHPARRLDFAARVEAPLPLEPERARPRAVEVVGHGESAVAREALRVGADQQMVRRLVHHLPRDRGGRRDAFERGDAARPPPRPVHAAGVELDDAVGVRQAAVADARIARVELDDGDAGDERLEHVGARARAGRRRARRRSGRRRW